MTSKSKGKSKGNRKILRFAQNDYSETKALPFGTLRSLRVTTEITHSRRRLKKLVYQEPN